MGAWSDAALRRWGLALFGLTVTLALATLPLGSGLVGNPARRHPETSVFDLSLLLYVLAMAASGLLVVWHRPRNSVGWVLALSGAVEALCDVGQAYGTRALALPDEGLPWGAAALSFSAPLWIVAVVIPVTSLLLRYPSGTIEGRWSRRVERGVLAGLVLMWFAYAGGSASVTDEIAGGEPPVVLPQVLGAVLAVPALVLILTGLAFTLVSTVARTVRAQAPERQQLALLVAVAPPAVVLLMTPWEWTQNLFFAVPFAVVVGVLRYRLLGIEVVIRRALLYGGLTAAVLVVFVAATAAVSSLVPSGNLSEVVAAAVVAVGVVPLRDRLQRVVDRFVYGDRRDPLAALTRLGSPMGLTRDGSLLPEVLQGLSASLRAPGAELVGVSGTRAVVGTVGPDAEEVPLLLGGEEVGRLRLATRQGEERFPAADRRLLDALAPTVATVLHAVELAEALRVEQERVVAATATERARLRQELHDGLGPSLTGIGLGLEALQSKVGESDLVARLRAETTSALEEVRRIIDGLRPGALETADLLALLRLRAEHLSATTPVRVEVLAPDRLLALPEPTETAALRVVEEALTNVVRHAGARRCTVSVEVDDALRIEVRDDGRGYDGPRQDGVGVASMAARAQVLGGTCSVSGTAGGTTVSLTLPLVPQAISKGVA